MRTVNGIFEAIHTSVDSADEHFEQDFVCELFTYPVRRCVYDVAASVFHGEVVIEPSQEFGGFLIVA